MRISYKYLYVQVVLEVVQVLLAVVPVPKRRTLTGILIHSFDALTMLCVPVAASTLGGALGSQRGLSSYKKCAALSRTRLGVDGRTRVVDGGVFSGERKSKRNSGQGDVAGGRYFASRNSACSEVSVS